MTTRNDFMEVLAPEYRHIFALFSQEEMLDYLVEEITKVPPPEVPTLLLEAIMGWVFSILLKEESDEISGAHQPPVTKMTKHLLTLGMMSAVTGMPDVEGGEREKEKEGMNGSNPGDK